MIPIRRLAAARQWRVRLWQLAFAGAVVGFLTGLICRPGRSAFPCSPGTDSVAVPFLGSEAASSLVLYLAKMATFGQLGAPSWTVLVRGLAIGTALMAGPFLARPLVRRLPPHSYALVIDLVLVVSAAGMFFAMQSH